MRRALTPLTGLLGLGLIVLLVMTSVAIGSRPIPMSDVWQGIWHRDRSTESIIIWELRMPRTLLALTVGAALGIAGAVMQALTRNPLAEPGILGVNAGAAFAVVVAIAGLGITSFTGYVWFACAGAALASTLVWAVNQRAARSLDSAGNAQTRLLLAGVALSACLGACTGIITMFDQDAFDSYRFWVVGSLANRDESILMAFLPFAAAGLLVAGLLGSSLNALALGDDVASSLGVRVALIRVLCFAVLTLLCGAATAAAGPIAFVGLVVPHVARLIAGPDQRSILALALIIGPALVLAADIIGRVIARPGEIEAGIVTAFIGAPVLLRLVLTQVRSAR
ncbi:FecCD family ABC transporter permease [Kineosporia babensis]|uniref:Iron chelate uptake ABC transporter family permease subunit n=1 Tax=Kineosporia babensis TaxID=499548 RepID=A0A9X1SXB6_9ACTN|nr:iron chelate uptake ABC transporter family permease subunit [Kineosporia babensis]